MRIANLDTPSGWRLAAVEGELVIDLNRAAQLAATPEGALPRAAQREAAAALPAEIGAWLGLGAEGLAPARQALRQGLALVEAHGLPWAMARQLACPLAEAPLAPPVPPRATVLAIGLNYRSHAQEAKMEVPKYPLVFAKPAPSLAGPREPARLPRASRRIDYEGEIAVIIGRRCHAVEEAAALDHVGGYALANDLSARDWQFRTSEMMLGKAFDGFCPIGPWLVTADEVPDPAALRLATRVNGEGRQDAPASDMIFGVAQLVAYLSQAMTLEPGDAILTGTPDGIGATRNPRLYLAAGDVVEVEGSHGLGTLVTRMV